MSLLLAVITVVTYWPVRLNSFLDYDDQEYVTRNPHVRGGLTWSNVTWAATKVHSANWHPVTWLSHMVDCQLFGLNPAGHHLVNLAVHVANTLVLFLVLSQMTSTLWRSALVAALFALHPLHVESVAWVAERKDLLCSLFGLLSLWAYAHYARVADRKPTARPSKLAAPAGSAREPSGSAAGGSGKGFYCLSLIFFVLSLMCKPMMVSLPGVLLLLDLWPLSRIQLAAAGQRDRLKKLAFEKVPYLLLTMASCVITLQAQQPALHNWEAPLAMRASNALVAYARYLGKTVWPADLAVLYPYQDAWPIPAVVGASLLLLLVSVLAVMNLGRRPWLAMGWCWFLGMLVPVLGLVQVGVQAIADRYTYLPLVGLFILTAWSGAEWCDRHKAKSAAWTTPPESGNCRIERREMGGLSMRSLCSLWRCCVLPWRLLNKAGRALGAIAAGVALVACSVLTHRQLAVWRDTETLFTHAVAVTERNWVAHYNLGLAALRRYQDLLLSLTAQVRSPVAILRPEDQQTGDLLEKVVFHCRAAIAARPNYPDPLVTLAKALTEQGRLEEARTHLEEALRLDGNCPEARENLAEILSRQGQAQEAVAQYQAALALKPDWDSVLNNLAWLRATHPDSGVRNGVEAVGLAERACGLTGHTNLWFIHTLAAAYAEAGDFNRAVEAGELACRLANSSALSMVATQRLNLYREGKPLRAPR